MACRNCSGGLGARNLAPKGSAAHLHRSPRRTFLNLWPGSSSSGSRSEVSPLLQVFYQESRPLGFSSSSSVHSSFICQMGGRRIGLDQKEEKGLSIMCCFWQS